MHAAIRVARRRSILSMFSFNALWPAGFVLQIGARGLRSVSRRSAPVRQGVLRTSLAALRHDRLKSA
jgi:hypothetical protein